MTMLLLMMMMMMTRRTEEDEEAIVKTDMVMAIASMLIWMKMQSTMKLNANTYIALTYIYIY